MNATITLLKDLIRQSVTPEREKIPFSMVQAQFGASMQGGLPRGALIEVSGDTGSGKTQVVLKLLAENPSLRVAWIEKDFTIYPCVFPQSQVELGRVLFVDSCLGDTNWTVHQVLRSQIFGIVVLADEIIGKKELRRLQLEAERANACVILLSEKPRRENTWPIHTRLEVRRSIQTDFVPVINVAKTRGQK
jgi:hypothetical protein